MEFTPTVLKLMYQPLNSIHYAKQVWKVLMNGTHVVDEDMVDGCLDVFMQLIEYFHKSFMTDADLEIYYRPYPTPVIVDEYGDGVVKIKFVARSTRIEIGAVLKEAPESVLAQYR